MIHGLKSGTVSTLAVTMALLLSAPALAGDHPGRPKLDTNEDGKIDLAEVQAVRPDFTIEKFNAADANRDGQLSREEWSEIREKYRRIGHLDTNQDGNFTFDEMRAARPELTQQEYAAFDADQDGKVTKEELRAAHKRRHEHHEGSSEKPAEPPAGG